MADYVLMIKYAYVHVDRMCCVLYPYATGACGKYCSLGNRSSFKYTAYSCTGALPVGLCRCTVWLSWLCLAAQTGFSAPKCKEFASPIAPRPIYMRLMIYD